MVQDHEFTFYQYGTGHQEWLDVYKRQSIYRKLKKLGYDFSPENIQTKLHDVAGVRVVCAFVDDIYTVADLLAAQDEDVYKRQRIKC